MADIDIVVDSGDLKAAIALLNEYGQSFTGMVNKVQTEGNRLARASKATAAQVEQAFNNSLNKINNDKLAVQARQEAQILRLREQNWKQFFQSYGKSQAGLNGAPSSAGSSALLQMLKDEEQQAKVNAQALKALEQEKVRLTAAYNPLLAAQRQYEQSLQEINRATELQIIDTKQQAAALQQLDREYEALGQGVYLAGSRFNQFGEMAGISGKAASRFGMYAQQAGYQVGDFAVQLQSGANAGVAFSQQAAQLAGLIPGLAGALTTFAAIGVGLGIQAMTRFNEDGRKGKDIYDDLGATLSNLEALTFSNITGSLSDSAKTIRAEFQATFDLIERVETQALKNNLLQPLKEMESELKAFQTRNQLSNQLGSGDASFNYLGFTDPDRAIQAFSYLKQIQGETREELSQSLNLQTMYLQGSGLLTAEVQARLAIMAEELGIVESTTQQAETLNSLYESQRVELTQSNELLRLKAQFGEQSVQYLNAEREQTLQNLRTEMERAGVGEILISQIIQMKNEQIGYEQAAVRSQLAVETLQRALEGISGIDISSVFLRAQAAANGLLGTVNAIGRGLSQVGQLGLEAQAIQAENAALKGGASPGQARIAGETVRFGNSLNLPDGPLNNIAKGFLTKAFQNQSLENLSYTEENAQITSAWNASNNPKGGGKGNKPKLSDAEKEIEKSQDKLKEFFEQYNLNIKQQERLLGVQGEQRQELEKVIEIENRLGEARTMVSQAQIEAMAREELALERKLQREQEIYNLGKNSVESLLMTVVQGTASIEDAFKVMLSNIIMEIYQQYVAKGAADMAGNALVSLLSANGNAFGAGGVKMFAKGGVVGSPTLFGYGGNKTGMMGEAGPEAIMPLKRNSQGRLGVEVSGGGGSQVNVYHNFNIAANGDDSVNRIIQSHIPRITEASKRAVIDANRRSQKGFR